MNKKITFSLNKISALQRMGAHRSSARRVGLLLSVALLLLGVGVGTNVLAQGTSAKSIADYCGELYGGDIAKTLACYSGAQLGATEGCSTYPPNDGAGLSDACNKAARAQKDGVVKKDEPPKPTTNSGESGSGATNGTSGNTAGGTSGGSGGGSSGGTESPSASPTANPNQDLIDALTKNTESLNQVIEALNKLDPNANEDNCDLDDTDPTYYPSGACTKQSITVLNPSTNPGGSSPAILFFNGGAWHGNDQTGQFVAQAKDGAFDAKTAGYVMLDVEYRKGSSGVYYMLEDVLRGIKHVTENASEYGIDPSRIAIWGDSSAGSLVARAAATGKSGAKAVVAWSAETNAWTGLFKSIQTLGIGIDHTTCIPTDLAGITNIFDLFTGGSGEIAEYGQGINSNNFAALGIGSGLAQAQFDPFAIMTQLTLAGRNAGSILSNAETISQQINSQDTSGLFGGLINVGTKKLVECIDNFNTMSPALFASPDTPPMFLLNMENDGLVGPEQAYGMRDKLRQLGVKSDALIVPPPPGCESYPTTVGPAGTGGCHLGYHPIAVCPSVKFLNEVLQPDNPINCETDKTASGSPSSGGGEGSGSSTASGGTGTGGGGGGGSSTASGGTGTSGGGGVTSGQDACKASGGTLKTNPNGTTYCTGASIGGAADPTKEISNYTCLTGKDQLVKNSDGGFQCVWSQTENTGVATKCTGGSRPLNNGTCAYGALYGYEREVKPSYNCKGDYFTPGNSWGSFSGTCLTRK